MDKNIRFLSALALFKTLYGNHKDIYALLSQFIVAAMRQSTPDGFSTTDVIHELEKSFKFDNIPNSVISSCLRLSEYFTYKAGSYSLRRDVSIDAVDESVEENVESFSSFIGGIVEEIEHSELRTLQPQEKDAVRDCLYNYLQGNIDSKSPYFEYVSAAIIKREDDESLRQLLNDMQEGLILYNGVRYDANWGIRKKWKSETMYFLDAHYLFSAGGLNGEIYKQYFMDFYRLQKEISEKGDKTIHLTYFKETKDVVDKFFACAERIKEGAEFERERTTAMTYILKHTKTAMDVVKLKSRFLSDLQDLGINEYELEFSWERNKDFIFDTKVLLDKFSDENSIIDEEGKKDYLKIADCVNILRKGRLHNEAANIKCVFLTDSKNAIDVSYKIKEIDNQCDYHVFDHMDIYTERMWLHLGKALSNDQGWASFDIINRTKTALSGLFNEKLTTVYKELEKQDKKENEAFYAELRSRDTSAEHITPENVESDIAYWNEVTIEKYNEEQALLKQKAEKAEAMERLLDEERESKEQAKKENESLKNELRKEKYKEILRRRTRAKRIFRFIAIPIRILLLLVLPSVCLLYFLFELRCYITCTTDLRLLQIQNLFWVIGLLYSFNSVRKKFRHGLSLFLKRRIYRPMIRNSMKR